MMKWYLNTEKVVASILISLCLTGCTEPIGIEGTDDGLGLLVMEGFISTEHKKHAIRLTETARFGSIFENGGFVTGVEDASVIVRNDRGQIIEFVDVGEGYYESMVSFSAQIGRSYSLLVELADGRSFLSLPVLVTEVTPITALDYQYEEVLASEDNEILTGFEVNVTLEDPVEPDNFYLWQAEGLYELHTFPKLHLTSINGMQVPDPKECCAICWHTESFESVRVDTDNLFNGGETRRPAFYVEDNGLRFFNDKYMLRIKQYAISGEVYDFYSQLFKLLDLNGDIFDPPPSTLLGNLINTDDPSEFAIGYFWAADVSIDSIFLDGGMLPQKKPQAIVPDDCRELPGATTIEPIFWND